MQIQTVKSNESIITFLGKRPSKKNAVLSIDEVSKRVKKENLDENDTVIPKEQPSSDTAVNKEKKVELKKSLSASNSQKQENNAD